MKKFDHDGLLLAEYQGKLFERSTELGCSTAVFLRRFMHSDLVKELDKNNPTTLSLDVNEGMNNIQRQYGASDYGRTKYSEGALFWMGYMYRYLSYTRDISTKFAMKHFPYRQLNDVYYSFHTQDPEWCVQNLLEISGLSESFFDKNLRLKAIIAASGRY